jgi:hypothetical protein
MHLIIWSGLLVVVVAVALVVSLFAGLIALMSDPAWRRGIWSTFGLICAVVGVGFFFVNASRHSAIRPTVSIPRRHAESRAERRAARTEPVEDMEDADAPASPLIDVGPKVVPKKTSAAPKETAANASSKATDTKSGKTDVTGQKNNAKNNRARPSWVDAPPKSDDDTYYIVKKVGPYTTPVECDGELPSVLQTALGEYVELYLGREASDEVRLGDDELREHIADRWQETVPIKIGDTTEPMYQEYVEIAFDRSIQARIRSAWENARVMARLRKTGTGLGGTLCFLAVLYLGLRLRQPRQSKTAMA